MTLPEFAGANVLVVGDIMLDRYWYGPAERISPEAPVPVIKVNEIEERPGGAANVAMNIASLGAQSQLIGLTGLDDAAQTLRQVLCAAGVTCHFSTVSGHPTITKLRVVAHNQQLIRIDFEQPFAELDAERMHPQVSHALSSVGALVLSDYAKGALAHAPTLIAQARQAGIPIVIDPKGSDFARYRGATLLTPNLAEFEAVAGKCRNDQEMVERGLQLMQQFQLTGLLITRSEQGMTLLQANKAPLHLPARTQEVYDVTGAGDTVIGVLAAALAAGQRLEDACYLANVAAGIVVGKLGTSTVSKNELADALRVRAGKGAGIVNKAQLKQLVKLAQQRGERVVMTNGCFDIFHAGHAAYLASARGLGNRLVVAVNSDDSVRQLKGPQRPINPLVHRMAVLSALEAVDWVVPFSETTPQRLIAEILPDMLVKGGDYRPDEIAGSQAVLANGGEVKVLAYEEGLSSSAIIDRICEGQNSA